MTNPIKTFIFLGFLSGILAISFGCSKKGFNASTSTGDKPVAPKNCSDEQNCITDHDYQIDATGSKADILFVVDNSGSMSPEQNEMGSKFPSFLNSISQLDYRIAITTTDISSSLNPADNYNGQGALQDGNLIPFASGISVLDGSLSLAQEQNLFLNTITRNETLTCENNNYNINFCPSGDERGLLAANMTLRNNPQNFIRQDGHMAIIFLSDEDERSEGYASGDLVDVEYPQNFLTSFQNMYPNKSIKAHSIVIRPNDNNCWNQQASGSSPSGHFGQVYAQLSELTGGILGDICASNYSNQLQEIGEDVAQPREILPCQPLNNQINVSFTPQPPYNVEITKNLEQKEILFSRSLPTGTKIRFQFQCENQ